MNGPRVSLIPSERQMETMSVLWQIGSGTVAQVRDALNDRFEPELARTTVLTYLKLLRARDWVQVRKEGTGYRYYPEVSLGHARWLELSRVTDLLYGGSREALLTDLLTHPQTPRWLLERLRRVLQERLRAPLPQRTTGSTRCDGRSAER